VPHDLCKKGGAKPKKTRKRRTKRDRSPRFSKFNPEPLLNLAGRIDDRAPSDTGFLLSEKIE
jgi:hypothetical protein